MDIADLKPLYKKGKKGIQVWSVSTDGAEVIVSHGQIGGKIKESRSTSTPKNIGKKNETSSYEQAILDAASKWRRQVKKGYVEDESGETSVRTPMGVTDINKKESLWNNVQYPVLGSLKLDGLNGTFKLEDESHLVLKSRGDEYYPMLAHLSESMQALCDRFGPVTGEIYKHGEHLEDIQSAVKVYNEDLTPKLRFYIFDVPIEGATLLQRKRVLDDIALWLKMNKVDGVDVILKTEFNSKEELRSYRQTAVDLGMEGIVFQDYRSVYHYNQKCSFSFKDKPMMDAEFKVVAVTADKEGGAVFTLEVPQEDGSAVLCDVRPQGELEERQRMAENPETVVGKYWKVIFQSYTKYGSLKFPTAKHERAVNNKGEPLE